MEAKWYFRKLMPGDKIREPIQGEFFATDAIRDNSEALIRESIQNSLDAAREGEKVKIRIYLSTETGALSNERSFQYFNNSWNHFRAEGNGLNNPPGPSDICPFLVFEDFGTSGLQGDVMQWHDKHGIKNAFFYFFRAEGRSGKGEKDRGRWGIGKYVFPRSSRINTFFGLTVRADDGQCLLMGQSVLRSHNVDNVYYSPDGLFGHQLGDGLTCPVSAQEFIKKFSQDFNLCRGSESGLSIVIPWCDPEIKKESLIEGILRGYFYPILTDNLEVTVETPQGKTVLVGSTIEQTVRTISADISTDLVPMLRLAQWARCQSENTIQCINIDKPDRAPRWTTDLIPEKLLLLIKESIESNKPVALRIPLVVQATGKEPRVSFFDVFFERDGGNESGNPVFIREGIIISDIRKGRVRGVRSLVIVEDEPLASMLGDSENPAHTQWQKDGSNFKNKYKYGQSVIDFVTRSVAEIIRILSDQAREEDMTLLADIFSLPVEAPTEAPKVRTKTSVPVQPEVVPDEPPPPPPSPPPPRSQLFRVQKSEGGFTVTNGEHFTLPAIIQIDVAYDIRRGNPLKKYKTSDFELDKAPIILDPPPEGIGKTVLKFNRMIAEVKEHKFKVTFSGFDEHRDIYVKVIRKGENG